MRLPALRLHQGGTRAPGRVLREARGSIKSAFARAFFHTFFHAFFRVFSRVFSRLIIAKITSREFTLIRYRRYSLVDD